MSKHFQKVVCTSLMFVKIVQSLENVGIKAQEELLGIHLSMIHIYTYVMQSSQYFTIEIHKGIVNSNILQYLACHYFHKFIFCWNILSLNFLKVNTIHTFYHTVPHGNFIFIMCKTNLLWCYHLLFIQVCHKIPRSFASTKYIEEITVNSGPVKMFYFLGFKINISP
jgi:hypothetical protein